RRCAVVMLVGGRRTVLTADPDRLGQVLTNLLDNAVRHPPPREDGCSWACSGTGQRCGCRSGTLAAESLPSTCRTSSSASTAPTLPGTAPTAGQELGSPSSTPSST